MRRLAQRLIGVAVCFGASVKEQNFHFLSSIGIRYAYYGRKRSVNQAEKFVWHESVNENNCKISDNKPLIKALKKAEMQDLNEYHAIEGRMFGIFEKNGRWCDEMLKNNPIHSYIYSCWQEKIVV